jgi:hypothetical protein
MKYEFGFATLQEHLDDSLGYKPKREDVEEKDYIENSGWLWLLKFFGVNELSDILETSTETHHKAVDMMEIMLLHGKDHQKHTIEFGPGVSCMVGKVQIVMDLLDGINGIFIKTVDYPAFSEIMQRYIVSEGHGID